MMEYKKPKEQIAFDYRTRISSHPASQRKEQGRRSGSSSQRTGLIDKPISIALTWNHVPETDL